MITLNDKFPFSCTDPRPSDDILFYARFLVIQSIFVTGVIALWFSGLAAAPFQGQSAPFCIAVAAVFAVGMLAILLKRFAYAQWVATQILFLGLLGTVTGLIVAFSAAQQGLSADPAAQIAVIGQMISGMKIALFVTFFGIVARLWLKLNLKHLGGE